MSEYLIWDDVRSGIWSEAMFTWSEAIIIQEITNLGNGGASIQEIQDHLDKQPDKKKEKIIQIIAKLEGKEYLESKKPADKKIKITIKDVEFLVEKLNIKVHV